MENIFESASKSINLSDAMSTIIEELSRDITDAQNQAENDCDLGMAVAVGNANKSLEKLKSLWSVIKKM